MKMPRPRFHGRVVPCAALGLALCCLFSLSWAQKTRPGEEALLSKPGVSVLTFEAPGQVKRDVATPSSELAPGQAQRTLEDEIIELLDLWPGMVAADIGAGNGSFALRLAEIVGCEGRVYANEIDPEFANLAKKVEGMKANGNAPNLNVILGKETDPLLPEKADLISLLWVYHHLSKPDDFMANIPKYLKSGGRLAVVAIDIGRVGHKPAGQSDPCRSKPAETQASVEKAGFALKKLEYLTGYPELYVLIFELRRPS